MGDILNNNSFIFRHIGISNDQLEIMLKAIGCKDLEQLIKETIPNDILYKNDIELPNPLSEYDFLKKIKQLASKNIVAKSFIGQGYYQCIIPNVILRNVLENPGWYTAYTPYQAEISQGRLEALLNFQTLITDLTGMEIANASLLDEATAVAEAMGMFFALRKGDKKNATEFLVDKNIFPQTLEVLKTRALPLNINLKIVDLENIKEFDNNVFGIFVQYPNNDGAIIDWSKTIQLAKANDIKVAISTDLLSLTLLTPPGEWDADVVVGNTQRMGMSLGYGGPHAAFFATKEEYKRNIPGRIIGVSKDKDGKIAYRMALQTREQHIKREKATSNICTAQVLPAIMVSMYAVYNGPKKLKSIALKVHSLAITTANNLKKLGFENVNKLFFDTLKIKVENISKLKEIAESKNVNFRYFDNNYIGISFDETHDLDDVNEILNIFSQLVQKSKLVLKNLDIINNIENKFSRKNDYLSHPVFNIYHTEHEMLRYLKRLENKDISLTHSMISLGSCTMKLNATTEMIPVTWESFANIHPFAPEYQTKGYQQLIKDLEDWLTKVTNFDAISLQPNSGAQGEYAGLMVIRKYFEDKGQTHRKVALIPSSAHGTNPASAIMAGMSVVVVACDENGNIDVEDLKNKLNAHSQNIAVLMITYPSTHGVFEENIISICEMVHKHGGQIYMDGANMNAQICLTAPGLIGADVCHLNLHKTFCIPHGGGGPGMGPIGVAKHLTPFLPLREKGITFVSATAYGSASILPISYAYFSMMGKKGLELATKVAILNANYLAKRLEPHYPILYKGKKGRNAHEFIIDCRSFKKWGIEVEDVAKRLMDYGYHSPTVSFPVPGTMMIEPTESESLMELDRFCEVMIQIRNEIKEIENGVADIQDNVLKNAPHTQTFLINDNWTQSYSREKAAFPLPYLRENKIWPTVRRIDSALGDRVLICSCPPLEDYENN